MSSTVSKQIVERMADLARLQMSDAELEEATKNLEGIFGHFSAIQDIDTANTPTADDASGLSNITREDVAEPETLARRQDLLELAPQTHQDQIKVKAVFNG